MKGFNWLCLRMGIHNVKVTIPYLLSECKHIPLEIGKDQSLIGDPPLVIVLSWVGIWLPGGVRSKQ